VPTVTKREGSALERTESADLPASESSIEVEATRDEWTTAEPVPDSTVLLLSGPGGDDWRSRDLIPIRDALEYQVGTTTQLGDGERDVAVDELTEKLRVLGREGRPITLWLKAHGLTAKGDLEITLSKGRPILASDLFATMTAALGERYPISIFMTSCHGGAAMDAAAKHLPEGAVCVSLVSGEWSVWASLPGLTTTLSAEPADLNGNGWLEAEEILLRLLTHGGYNMEGPCLAVGQGMTRNLQEEVSAQLGTSYSHEERESIHRWLDPLLGQPRVDQVISKIETAPPAERFRNSYLLSKLQYGADGGHVYAVGLVARNFPLAPPIGPDPRDA
jgi:hypothetical protein